MAHNGTKTEGRYKSWVAPTHNHTFSAFWLRSSVVSVLISLISDTCSHVGHQTIKLIFEARLGAQELALARSYVASVLHYSQSAAGALTGTF